jgi:Zn-dependent protease with chaperone function
VTPFKPLVQLLAIMGPLGALYYCSRRFEYFADDEAVDFTGDPEAIRALLNLHQIKESPRAYNTLAGMFATHPTLLHRIRAVAGRGHVSADRLTELIREAADII